MGQRGHANRHLTAADLPPPPWEWSDDTEMACSVVACLRHHGRIDQDALATSFATRMDIGRRYGAGALEILERIRDGRPWRVASVESFGGNGSFGNGAAMRVAPLGAYYAGDPARAAAEATLQAKITHTHTEGIAGAVAVAVAASLAATGTAEDVITAAIVGGVIAARTGIDGIPSDWLDSREPLPGWLAR